MIFIIQFIPGCIYHHATHGKSKIISWHAGSFSVPECFVIPSRIRIYQDLISIETISSGWVKGSAYTISIVDSGLQAANIYMPEVKGFVKGNICGFVDFAAL